MSGKMTKYVALLRGINVGGNKKVEMSKLKKVFISLGLENVSTYINSGNVIFETDENVTSDFIEEIERALLKSFKFEIKIVVRDSRNIQELCKAVSAGWTNDTEQKTDILFLWDEFNKKSTLKLIESNPAVDRLKHVPGAIVWNVSRVDYAKSGMNKFIGTAVYKHMTARNINTVRKLAELMQG